VASLSSSSGLSAAGARLFAGAVLLTASSGLGGQIGLGIPALAELSAASHLLAGALGIQLVFAYPHGITFSRGLGIVSRTDDLALTVRRTI
jgi:hypothetical protein